MGTGWPRRYELGVPGAAEPPGASLRPAGGRGQTFYSEGNYPQSPNKSTLHTGVLFLSDGKPLSSESFPVAFLATQALRCPAV